MRAMKLKWIGVKIEYHWWRIQVLRKRQDKEAEISLHKFEAEQLRYLYEVVAGLRDTRYRAIG